MSKTTAYEKVSHFYNQLSEAVMTQAQRVGLLNASGLHSDIPIRHNDTIKLVQVMGQAAQESTDKRAYGSPATPSLDVTSHLNNKDQAERTLGSQYLELARAISKAGKGIGIISTDFAGVYQQQQAMSVIHRVGDAAIIGMKNSAMSRDTTSNSIVITGETTNAEINRAIDARQADQITIDRDKFQRQRDRLAHAISGAAIKAGGCREDADLTGPMLVQLVNDMATTLIETQQALAEKTQKLDAMAQTNSQGKPGIATVPDFKAIEGKRVGEMTTEQFNDATESWLRSQKGYLSNEAYITFLCDRLDEARGLKPIGTATNPAATEASPTGTTQVRAGDPDAEKMDLEEESVGSR